MTYKVLNNEGLNSAASKADDYASTVESALNNLERQGFLLVQIEQATDEDAEPYYIFHKVDEVTPQARILV